MSLIKLLKEVSIPRLVELHGQTGYIVITAFRNEISLEENYRRNKILKKHIDASGYSYFAVWGGYVEQKKNKKGKVIKRKKGEEKLIPVKEKGFLVTNFKRGSSIPMDTTDELKSLGEKWCTILQPEQESFLYVPKNSNGKVAYHIKPDGSVDMTFNRYSSTKIVDEYFTSLNKARPKVEQDFTRRSLTFREK